MKKSNVLDLLKQLELLASRGDEVYPTGIFPSQRYHPFLPYSREDDNLFFTATIAYILKSHLGSMDEVEEGLSKTIIESATSSFPLFRNKDGRPTYNFWQTKPSRHFPNGVFMNRFEHFRIPDDADDSSLAHLLVDHNMTEKQDLQKRFSAHANLNKKPIVNTWPEFKAVRAISTFFGEKMRIEFDAVVMCNTLLFWLDAKEENNVTMDDSLNYIEGIIEGDYHLTSPFYASPNYPRSELIIYHVARLLQKFPEIGLSKYRRKLVQDLEMLIGQNLPPLNRLVASNAKLMLCETDYFQADQLDIVNDTEGYFFHAGMMSAFENPLAQKISENSFFHLRYRCKALNITMLIEHELLRRSA